MGALPCDEHILLPILMSDVIGSLQDLGGEAVFDLRFSAHCIMAAFLSLISSLRFDTDSEDEELNEINRMWLGLQVLSPMDIT